MSYANYQETSYHFLLNQLQSVTTFQAVDIVLLLSLYAHMEYYIPVMSEENKGEEN